MDLEFAKSIIIGNEVRDAVKGYVTNLVSSNEGVTWQTVRAALVDVLFNVNERCADEYIEARDVLSEHSHQDEEEDGGEN